ARDAAARAAERAESWLAIPDAQHLPLPVGCRSAQRSASRTGRVMGAEPAAGQLLNLIESQRREGDAHDHLLRSPRAGAGEPSPAPSPPEPSSHSVPSRPRGAPRRRRARGRRMQPRPPLTNAQRQRARMWNVGGGAGMSSTGGISNSISRPPSWWKAEADKAA